EPESPDRRASGATFPVFRARTGSMGHGASPPPPSPAGRDIIPIVAQGPPAGHAMIGSLIFRWNRSPTAEYSTRPRFASTMEAMMYVPMPRRSPFVDRPYVLNSRSAMSGGSGA